MTKAELVEEVARAAELNKRDAEVIVETVFGSIIGALHKGRKGRTARFRQLPHSRARPASRAESQDRRAGGCSSQTRTRISSPAKSSKSTSPRARQRQTAPPPHRHPRSRRGFRRRRRRPGHRVRQTGIQVLRRVEGSRREGSSGGSAASVEEFEPLSVES